MSRTRIIFALAAGVLLVNPTEVLAWGPATHMKLAGDLLGQLELIPAALAVLLSRHTRDYLFGNIAADVVLAKRLSRVKQFCHHWSTGFAILENAPSDRGRAFGFGYLSHLAADTIAHNKFVPRQMTLTKTTLSFGHLYWELRADSTIGPYHWQQLREVLKEVFAEHECSLSTRMNDTFLPFTLNWQLFHRMNRFLGRQTWRRAMDRWYAVSRWQLSDQLMREYRSECLERMIDVLIHQQHARVLHEDPNGNAALTHTRARRRQLRQMARCGLVTPYVFHEVAANHAPMVRVHMPRSRIGQHA